MTRLRSLGLVALIAINALFLLAQVETFPRYRLVGGASGIPAEVTTDNTLLMSLTGTAAAQDDGLASTLPRVRLAGGITGNLAEVDSTGHLLVSQIRGVGSAVSSATPTINTDAVSFYILTAQAADITSFTTNLSGTPTSGQTLWIAIIGTGARAITWGTSFEASTVALPTTTVSTNRLDVGFIWSVATGKWRCVAAS